MSPSRHSAKINGIRLSWLEMGEGPVVVLCHGFPELAISWRKQMPALAAAGYRAVAPDMRGFGETDAPEDIGAYTLFHLVGDVIGLIDHLGAATAVVVGHDWGAPVAWHCGLFRPDRVRAVAGLSIVHQPRGAISLPALLQSRGLDRFYMLHFQEPGVAEAELSADPYQTHLRLFHAAGGDGGRQGLDWPAIIPEGRSFVDAMPRPERIPPWTDEATIREYAATFQRTGYRGGLNWYRNLDRNWELGAAFAGAPITVPTLFVAGALDGAVRMPGMDKAIAALPRVCRDHRGTHLIEGVGHWVQQEAADDVNRHLLEFLAGL